MGFKRFSILVIVRVSLLFAVVATLAAALATGNYPVLCFLLAVLVLLQTTELIRFISKTNNELQRFLESAKHADFSQRFGNTQLGSGFEELGQAFNDILIGFEANTQQQEQRLRYLKALIDHVPVPSLSLHSDDSLSLNNNAARRLFANYPASSKSDLVQLAPDLPDRLNTLKPGQRGTVVFNIEGAEKKFTLAVAQISIGERIEKLISLQDIQPELDDAQLQAWQALVRVLTHEIMNSITPISSLSATTVDLVESARRLAASIEQQESAENLKGDLDDVHEAVSTIAHRSDSLTQFVTSYRKLTRLPQPSLQPIELQASLGQLASLMMAEQGDKPVVNIVVAVEPSTLQLKADPEMFEQVVINLMKNAIQALAELPASKTPEIKISAKTNRRGQLTVAVQDNGPGISDVNIDQVFVPFFTTKRDGSGVGLALTRQVMTAHGGSVSIQSPESGGTEVLLTF